MNDLAAIVSDLSLFYQRRIPSDQTISQWFTKVDGLNLRAGRKRIVEIITNGEAFPRNMPAAIRSAYSTWLRDQSKDYRSRGCAHCLGGLLHSRKDGYVYAFRCGHCNSSETPYPTRTRDQLAEQGYTLYWQHDFSGSLDRSAANERSGGR
jgi:hypothetical protein